VRNERRIVLIGLTSQGRLVVVAHLEITTSIHIVSARMATRPERRSYEEEL
jgi:uncharacterized DUF497 family protein